VDLALYFRVLWRFRVLVVLGVLIGTLLAMTSFARIGFDGPKPTFSTRGDEVWLSASTLFVTQEGFPWGRTIFDETVKVAGSGDEETVVPRFGDPGRYSGLATLYVELAKGDEVRRAFRAKAPRGVTYQPEVVKSSDGGSVLPMIYMKGFGPTPRLAEAAANLAADEFRTYLASEQAQARIAKDRRVSVVVTSRAIPAELVEPRSIVRPIFLFLLALMGTIGLAFVLENLRPASRRSATEVRPVVMTGAESHPAAGSQRSA
jgi:hypothetical protein